MRYWLFSRHYKGFGIHSPFVFYLVRELIYERHPYYAFKQIDAARRMMLRNKQMVDAETGGAASWTGNGRKTIRKIVRGSSLPPKYGRLLFRLVTHFNARDILELGTGPGLGTLSLALPDSRSKVVTLEGNPQMSAVARKLFEVVEVENARVVNGSFQQTLPQVLKDFEKLDFVFFDGDHRYSSTLTYFEMCLGKIHNDSVFVFDDIHWSPGMEKAWREITRHPRVTISIDMHRIGLVFFRRECTKQHYVVRY
ncbi:MAG: O-methyltransferase [Bacteroidota bacterium]